MKFKEWILLFSLPFAALAFPFIWLVAKLILCPFGYHIPGWEFKTSKFDRTLQDFVVTRHIKSCAFCDHEKDLLK